MLEHNVNKEYVGLQDYLFAFYLQKIDLTYNDEELLLLLSSQGIRRVNVAMVHGKIQVTYVRFGIQGPIVMRENGDTAWLSGSGFVLVKLVE